MLTLNLLVALAVTVLPAWVWLERLVPKGTTCRRLLIAGYALLLGMIGITLVMRLLSALAIPFSLVSIGSLAALVCLAGLFAPAGWRAPAAALPPVQTAAPPMTGAQRVIIGICLVLLAGRLIALGIEVGSRPLFAWDAKQHWTKQARVFFEMRSIVPYVSLQEWLAVDGQGVYTNMHPDYPITTPLLQTWVNVALGQWHDSLMNLPWLLIWISLGLIFYAQARSAAIGPAISIAATYMVLSLPYLNVHVALAGYADLLLALCFLAALAAFYNWSRSRNPWQGAFCIACALSCLLIKNEGFYWLASLLPGLLLAGLGLKRGLVVSAALLLCLGLVIGLMPQDWAIAGHSLQELSLGYRPEAWRPIYQSFLQHDNWHFLGYLFFVAMLLLMWRVRQFGSDLAPVTAVVLSALALCLCLFLFTHYAIGAVRLTSLNRVCLQLMPAVAFLTLLVYAKVAMAASGSQPGPAVPAG